MYPLTHPSINYTINPLKVVVKLEPVLAEMKGRVHVINVIILNSTKHRLNAKCNTVKKLFENLNYITKLT